MPGPRKTAASSAACAISPRRSPHGRRRSLVFTQFREIDRAAGGVPRLRVRPPGLVLHGGTAVGKRKELVRRFQEDEGVPFFVLSVKAGGAGPQPDRGLARDPLRSLVEPGGGEPGDRPCIPHRPDPECAGAQVRLPRHRRGEDRPLIESKRQLAGDLLGGGGETCSDRDERRGAAEAGGARSRDALKEA